MKRKNPLPTNSTPLYMSSTPAVAVIGSGYWGKNLVRNYHSLNALKLVCDKDESILEKIKEQYSGVETCIALTEITARDDIQGVVISTPAETHYNLAMEALLSGKHVYVEKPLALNEAEGEELVETAKERNLVLMVGHLLQYHPSFNCLKDLAKNGELGKINYIYSNRLNLGKIRREENILWSFAPHDISMILSLTGEYPDAVFATGGNYLHRKIADVTTTHLEFPSGLRAHIFVSWLHPFKEQKLVVVGDRKMAVFDDTQPWKDKLLLYPHEITWKRNIPVPSKTDPERVGISQDEPLRKECEHFLDCIANGKKPITDGREGILVLKILNASQKSLDNDECKIYLKESNDQLQAASFPSTQTHEPETVDNEFFAHPTAVIDDDVTIGAATKIWHFSHILPGTEIGPNCNIGQNVVIGPDVTIGKNCKIQNNVSVYKGVTLEEGVFCGPSMVFTNIYNPRAEIRKMDQVRITLAKKGATIGANATIVCGVTLGRYSFIGAGSLVNKNVPNYALVVGNPAKQIGWACECGERLTNDLECLSCKKRFEKNPEGLVQSKRG